MKSEPKIRIENHESLDAFDELKQAPLDTPIPDLFYDRIGFRDKRRAFKQFTAFAVVGFVVALLLLIPFSFSVSGSARVEPAQEIVVESLVNGELVELYAHEGEKVKTGQKIALIYDRTNDQELVNAQAELKMTLQELQKLRETAKFAMKEAKTNQFLYYKDAITHHEKDKSDFEYATLLREIAIAKTKRENFSAKIRYLEKLKEIGTVRAPLDGIILTKVSHKLSTYFMKGDEILRIADMNKVYLGMPVDEHQLWRIREGTAVKIKFFAYPDKVFTGRVASIRYTAYEKTETVGTKENVIDVLIVVDEHLPFLVRPGAMAKTSIQGHGESVFQKLKNSLWL